MSQNLVSLHFDAAATAEIDQALGTLERYFTSFVDLSADDVRGLNKMGDKSEPFCRQALIVLDQNRQALPPSYDLAEAQNDLAQLDLLRPRLQRLRNLLGKGEDTEIALGSDILCAALEGYAFLKLVGKGAGLESLRETMYTRNARRKPTPPKE